jgi:DNA (cytosine-5)-methyltransferase 1
VVDVISGGFPCQAFSKAAAGKNTAEDLWPEMRRVVEEVSPRFVFAENVSKFAIDKAADDLESMGYKTKAIPLSAKDLGADHIRERYWLLAYTNNDGEFLRSFNAKARWLQELDKSIWESDPRGSRVSNGVAYRRDRLKATGNGQVPIVAATAFIKIIEAIKDETENDHTIRHT